jgi:hypothetical protein
MPRRLRPPRRIPASLKRSRPRLRRRHAKPIPGPISMAGAARAQRARCGSCGRPRSAAIPWWPPLLTPPLLPLRASRPTGTTPHPALFPSPILPSPTLPSPILPRRRQLLRRSSPPLSRSSLLWRPGSRRNQRAGRATGATTPRATLRPCAMRAPSPPSRPPPAHSAPAASSPCSDEPAWLPLKARRGAIKPGRRRRRNLLGQRPPPASASPSLG